LLLAITFGIIDFGFVFNDWVSVRQGGRDAMRQAVINPNPTGASACGADVGLATWGTSLVCYTKDRVGLDPANTRVKIYFDNSSGHGYKPGEPVKICVQYKTGSVTGAYSTILSGKVLDTEVESLIEQDSSSTFTGKVEENVATPPGVFKAWNTICPDSL
jgi:Flp pilus assembly protein TadG